MKLLKNLYTQFALWAGPVVVNVLLLLLRIIWGWQFHIAGFGKLKDISKPVAFFTDLHIPFPTANAWLVACVEGFGGLLLLVGLASRPVALALTINMTVAFLTADHDAVHKLFADGDPTALFNAAPFWFLVTSLIILARGPGWFSLDALAKPLLKNCCPTKPPAQGFPVVTPPSTKS